MGQRNSVKGWFNLYNKPLSDIRVDGFCDEKFIPVKEHFEKLLKNGADENLQLCVYVGGECVVDLYGTSIGDWSYGPDTLQVRHFVILEPL